MAFELTTAARNAADGTNVLPQLVLEIEGLSTLFGAVEILEVVRIGDDLIIGDDWVIGGSIPVADQETVISFDGTSSAINQQLSPDKGQGSSISSMSIALLDKGEIASQLITPGSLVTDVLGRRAKIYLGFAQKTSFKEDFIVIFKGIISDIKSDPTKVILDISHPDQKKRQQLFAKVDSDLVGAIDASVTSLTLSTTSEMLSRKLGPDGTYDSSILFYVRIDDEIIQYTGISGATLTGLTRGALGTTAAAHSDGASVSTFYRLTGNVIDLCLKLMLSGWDDYFKTGVTVSAFNQVSTTDIVDNAIFFEGVNVVDEYGLVIGDYITTTGATNGANNVTLKTISGIDIIETGSYITVSGVSFVTEPITSATISFRSQYDTLGAGAGLAMAPDEVDVTEHLRIQTLFLSGFSMDFYLKDTVDGKDFIEQELLLPAAAYSIPRKGQSSIGYHIGPIPGADILTLSDKNVASPSKIQIRRSLAKNFYNTIMYRYEEDVLEDKFLRGKISRSADSTTRIDVGTKAWIITSKGMRDALNAGALSTSATDRLLNRYKYGAEQIDQIEVLYGAAFAVEIGDIVVLDGTNLKLVDTVRGTRGAKPKLYEVVNKRFDIKTGKISLSLTDTGFSTSARYALIAPASKIKSGVSTTQFIIKKSFNSVYGDEESRKWTRFDPLPTVVVRSTDGVTRFGRAEIQSITGNTVTLKTALSFTPQADDLMELAEYDYMTDQIKLIYCFMHNGAAFTDGKDPYVML